MARPVVHDEALRQRLLDVTAGLVDQEGPDRVTLRDIAAAAATSTSAIYSLFGGKPQLLTAVVDYGFQSFHASQEDAARQGLKALGLAYRQWALEHDSLYRLMFGGGMGAYATKRGSPVQQGDSDPTGGAAAMAPLINAVTASQAEGTLGPYNPLLIATAFWGQVHGLVSLELARGAIMPIDWEGLYQAALDAGVRGWAPRPGEQAK